MRRILVTSALPYANGHIHIGHLVEYLQTDIWVRFQRLRGNRCVYICADDTHGTATMLRAREEGISEEELIARMQQAHMADFAGFDIEFDNYGSTHSPENRELCGEFWQSIRQAGMVHEREVEQLYDTAERMFLADRQVRGTCPNPKCRAADQPGDNCSVCSWHYNATDLTNPVSAISGTKPEVRKHPHLFINIQKQHDFLDHWTQSGDHLQPEIANYLKGHFLGEPLRDWDVSRPPPYFGFEIPDSPGNYWYVWFDAPIGYMASTRQWCDRRGEDFDDWWASDQTEIHHFIGKDITYFHTLFWPAMLKVSRYSLPTKIHIHGFLNVHGLKMSKSKGTLVRASTYLKHLDPAYLRYYYASKLTNRVDDLDLNLDEFVARVNSDMVGNVVNLASRTARFAQQTGLAPQYPDDGGLFQQAAQDGEAITEAYESCDYARATRQILAVADRANQYVEHNAPWLLAKDPDQAERLRDVCTVGLNLFRQLAVYLAPVLPRLASQTGELLDEPITRWEQSTTPLTGRPVGRFKHMMKRVDRRQVDAMFAASVEEEPEEAAPCRAAAEDSGEPLAAEPLAETISFEEFAKVDLRVARVVAAEDVPQAEKLMKLTLSLGGGQRRLVFAGIKGVYQPEELVGRLLVCAANLAERKMKFGTSEGMILASGPGGKEIYLLAPDEGAKPGQRVH
jgi:methionyl-tRNA synthetase